MDWLQEYDAINKVESGNQRARTAETEGDHDSLLTSSSNQNNIIDDVCDNNFMNNLNMIPII